jgi:hypothetical protein
MSDREFAFGQLLASLGPQTELDTETLQCVFNAGWDAREAPPTHGPGGGVMLTSDAAARDFARSIIQKREAS